MIVTVYQTIRRHFRHCRGNFNVSLNVLLLCQAQTNPDILLLRQAHTGTDVLFLEQRPTHPHILLFPKQGPTNPAIPLFPKHVHTNPDSLFLYIYASLFASFLSLTFSNDLDQFRITSETQQKTCNDAVWW